jgi:hypothetical protein
MFFKVTVSRSQIQTQTFTIEADNQADLEKTLLELDFGHIDSCFDEGEVESIEYDVENVCKASKPRGTSFADEDLQEMLNQV